MRSSLMAPDEAHAPAVSSVETSVKGEWIQVPALQINGANIVVRGKWLRTAIVLDEEWMENELENPELCIEALKGQKSSALRADLFTFCQKPSAIDPKYPYPVERDSVAVIRLTNFDDWWENLPQVTRKNVRRSQKRGVVVEVRQLDDNLIRDIIELSNDSPMRQGKPFDHYGKTFDQVKKDQSTHLGRCDFICAYSGRDLIGLLKIIYRKEVASILQFLPKASEQDKRPANALIAKAVEICAAKGLSHLTYGLFNYGNKRDSSLLEFKLRNGFEEVLVPRFRVPLTAKGAVCLRLKLHRRLVEMLPSRIVEAAVSVRKQWYVLSGAPGRRSSTTERPNSIRQMERSTPPAGSNQDQEESNRGPYREDLEIP